MAKYKKPAKPLEDTYLKNKEKEIPLYDPQTGEANLEYEKITGKPNPLLSNTDIEHDMSKKGAETISKEIRANMDMIPHDLEYKRRNRFLVHFPKEFGVNQLQIESVIPPMFEHKTSKYNNFFNLHKIEISDTTIVVRELEKTNVMGNLINRMEDKFDFTIELVDGQNMVLDKWIMTGCYIKQLSTNTLSYKADSVLNTILTISINKLVIK